MKLLERRNGNIFKGTTADAGTLKIDEIEAVITRWSSTQTSPAPVGQITETHLQKQMRQIKKMQKSHHLINLIYCRTRCNMLLIVT